MSDVFISYAREDRERAQALAQALEARGLSVWWDRVIPAGRQFDEVIEQQLDAARCAAVLWTAHAINSKWVKAEAGEALHQDKLVPALLEPGLRLPLEFRRVQTADLSAWRPGEPSPALDAYCNEVAAAVARAATTMRTHTRARKAAAPVAPPPPPAPPATRRRGWLWGVGGAVTAVIGLAWLNGSHDEDAAATIPMPIPTPMEQRAIGPAGVDQDLRWRDYALNFEGHLQWNGQTMLGTLNYRALDGSTGRLVDQGTLAALLLPNTGARRVFHAQIPVPMGDSRTPGAHTHAVNLIFEPAGNGWAFAGNCMDLSRPDRCWR